MTITFFLSGQGNRVTVTGRVGETLLEVAQRYKVDIAGGCDGGGYPLEIQRTDKWTETTYGEGPTCYHCHVKISSKYDDILYRRTATEIEEFGYAWEEEYKEGSSRLACQIKLDRRHDGMVAFVPSAPPVDLM